jgi:hypothetical protein
MEVVFTTRGIMEFCKIDLKIAFLTYASRLETSLPSKHCSECFPRIQEIWQRLPDADHIEFIHGTSKQDDYIILSIEPLISPWSLAVA